MKKRFTVMLDEKVIKALKNAAQYYTPTAWRETVENELSEFAYWIEQSNIPGEDIGTATVKEMREQNGD